MEMVPAVLTLVIHGELNTFINYPDLWFKDRGTFWRIWNSTLRMDSCGKETLFLKKPSKISIMPTSILFQSDHNLHTWRGHIQWTALPWQFATLIWTWNNLSAKLQQFGLSCLLAWQRSRLWDTRQDFCGIISLFRPQKFISHFLPQVILFQVLTSLWILYQQLSCYGQPVSAPQLPLLQTKYSCENTSSLLLLQLHTSCLRGLRCFLLVSHSSFHCITLLNNQESSRIYFCQTLRNNAIPLAALSKPLYFLIKLEQTGKKKKT